MRVSPFPKESRTFGPEPPKFAPLPQSTENSKPWLLIAIGAAVLAVFSIAAALYFKG